MSALNLSKKCLYRKKHVILYKKVVIQESVPYLHARSNVFVTALSCHVEKGPQASEPEYDHRPSIVRTQIKCLIKT